MGAQNSRIQALAASSPELARFLAGLDATAPAEDSHNVSELASVSPEVRTAAVEVLLERVRANGDQRAVMALANLGAVEALPVLRMLSIGQGSLAVVARRALVKLGPLARRDGGLADVDFIVDDEAVDGLIGDSAKGTIGERFASFVALTNVEDHAALHAILAALDDPDDLVRYQAFDSLIERLKLKHLVMTPDGSRQNFSAPLEIGRLMIIDNASPALRALGLARLRAAFGGLAVGMSPAALGLVYEGDPDDAVGKEVGRALRTPGAAFPIDAVKAASAHDRASAEAFWAVALLRSDARAADALAEVGAVWTLPVLQEALARAAPTFTEPVLRAALANGGDPSFAAHVARAIEHLNGHKGAEAIKRAVPGAHSQRTSARAP